VSRIAEDEVSQRLEITLIADGAKPISKESLNSCHCFLLDVWSEIFVWVGSQSTTNEKAWALLKSEVRCQTEM